MKKFTQLTMVFTMTALSTWAVAEQTQQPSVYQEAYAQYMLKHPEKSAQSSKALTENFIQDYQDGFKNNKKINEQEFVQFEQEQLAELMKKRREMSLKQTYVRYGILDANKDQKLTLKEFQEIALKSFSEFDKDQDGMVSSSDIQLAKGNATATHDGFRLRLPISMPMANNPTEFIRQYGQGKAYASLGDYLTGRDQQFFATDRNQDFIVSEQEYVDEFMQRYDRNTVEGLEKMKALSARKFKAMSNGKAYIQVSDIQKFSQKMDREISQ